MNKGVQLHDKDGNNIYPLAYYPVGAIYISTNSTNPSIYFGGRWEQIKDTFILACGDKYKNGETGGESEHQLTIDEIPSHSHGQVVTAGNSNGEGERIDYDSDGRSAGYPQGVNTYSAGGDKAHNNMPPYIAVYVWKRTA